MLQLATLKYGSNVLEKCIKYSSPDLKTEILDEVINKSSVDGDSPFSLMQLIRNNFANFVVQKVLDEASEEQRNKFIKKILTVAPQIRSQNKACRHVFDHLEKKYGVRVPQRGANNPILK